MLGLAAPSVAFADDGTPAEAPAGESAGEATPESTPAVEAPSSEPEPAEPAQEAPAPEGEAAQPEVVAEIVESLPGNTHLVVLDDAGEAMPLASEEAARVILGGDPMWCPLNVLPGGAGCTAGATSFLGTNGLLSQLLGKTGNGTVYVAWDYSSLNEEDYNRSIEIHQSQFSGLGALTI